MLFSRRVFVRSLVSAPFITAASGVRAQAAPIRIGFVPVIGAAALFVLEGAGWAKDVGLSLAITKFDSGRMTSGSSPDKRRKGLMIFGSAMNKSL